MSGAGAGETTSGLSPYLTIWWRPRRTIQDVVARPYSSRVLVLAALGGTASAVTWLLGMDVDQSLTDWRVLLACLVGAGSLSILNLYIGAWVAAGVGRLLGGTASTAELRTLLAWGMLPAIAGAVLAIAAVLGLRVAGAGAMPAVLAFMVGICSLWSMVMTLLMLGSVEGFGFFRSFVTYGISTLCLPAVFALLIRTFLFQPFSIPSGSTIPALLPGDYVFANKFAYGYSRFSLPFGVASFPGRVFGADPARGDMVIFRLPKDERTDYVKRVVGLPGDRIQMKDGELLINSTPVRRERMDDLTGIDACGSGTTGVRRWRETLPNGVSYETLDCADNGYFDNTTTYTVPAAHLFVLGDNRDNSTDSRAMSAIGFVPIDNLVARVSMIFFSRAAGGAGAPSSIRFERIGATVR
ncbi:peptidase S26A [Bradyrhizobium cosmicum]|uniref:Signal peptidase I n=1 Tax=Bradyrhizobium cosmicum TaxID=1404864 RepID=A0AAI8MD35_9BRAD|nr:peptidase S26A [Bradyrhizobium cosmicum]